MSVSQEEETISLKVDGSTFEVSVEEEMPLLWVLRDELGILGPKYGCGIAQCGACTVLIDGDAVRSCQVAAGDVWGAVTTIAALSPDRASHPLQAAWIKHQVAQCGYCQSGQILQAAALLEKDTSPTDSAIDAAMSSNLCRCGTYPRIRAAIHDAVRSLHES